MMNKPYSKKRRTKNDIVYTNPDFARKLVDYFKPTGFCLEPCVGSMNIYNELPNPKDWCEIQQGKDFLTYDPPQHVDYIISNFPWSSKALRPIAARSCELADNVIHLIRLHNLLGTYARHKDYLQHGHKLKEIIVVNWNDALINKSSEGFALVVAHLKKNYDGDCKWTYWI